tara:strand:- start:586 stop:744 length:159 start_codon:yes stop_codon:yes gene_type:complete
MKKRIGILIDSLSVSKQIIDLLKLSSKSDTYEITTLIINDIEKNNGNIIILK